MCVLGQLDHVTLIKLCNRLVEEDFRLLLVGKGSLDTMYLAIDLYSGSILFVSSTSS